MAQDFRCSNNINLLEPIGNFGSRHNGGKDHSMARYLSTKLSSVTREIFKEEDDSLLDYMNVDGKSVEPSWYIPIIPLVLVNGSFGIATGFSSYVSKFHAHEVINNLKCLLNSQRTRRMKPGYRKFQGRIEKKDGNYISHGSVQDLDQDIVKIT